MIGVADRPLMTGFYCLVAVNVVLANFMLQGLAFGLSFEKLAFEQYVTVKDD